MPSSPASTRQTASTQALSSAKSRKKTIKPATPQTSKTQTSKTQTSKTQTSKTQTSDHASGAATAQASGPANSVATSSRLNSAPKSSSVEFAGAARLLTRVARDRGLIGPSFRCPPRLVGVDRSIRRTAEAAVVSVRLRGRPFVAVLADMIEGVVVANRLAAPEADRLRSTLWQATSASLGVVTDRPVTGSGAPSVAPSVAGSSGAPGARVA